MNILPYNPNNIEEIKQLFTKVFSDSEGWLSQSLVSDKIKPIAGSSYCVKAFNNPEYW